MKENRRDKEDEIIRQMMQQERKKAPENLKFRIMHQIEIERALPPQEKSKKRGKRESGNLLREMGFIFGTMYAVIAAMVVGAYLLQGRDYLLTTQFIGPVVLVASSFSLFWLMTRLDAFLKKRRR